MTKYTHVSFYSCIPMFNSTNLIYTRYTLCVCFCFVSFGFFWFFSSFSSKKEPGTHLYSWMTECEPLTFAIIHECTNHFVAKIPWNIRHTLDNTVIICYSSALYFSERKLHRFSTHINSFIRWMKKNEWDHLWKTYLTPLVDRIHTKWLNCKECKLFV